MEKKFQFVSAAALRAFKSLPREIQSQFGSDLNNVQHGLAPFSDFKHLDTSVGPGAIELIENGSPAFRTVYCAKYQDTVYILHSFDKTTNGVGQQEMDTAKARYKEMMAQIREAEAAIKKPSKLQPKARSKGPQKRR